MTHNTRLVITWVVIIFFMLGLVYVCVNHNHNRNDPHAIEVIQKRYYDSLNKSYEGIIKAARQDSADDKKRIIVLTDSINFYKQKINNNEDSISAAQSSYIIKIKRVNTLSTDGLALFFTSRFGGQQ